jgi:hypothetical protein
MSKTRNYSESDWNDAVIHGGDIDLDEFIDSMESPEGRPARLPRGKRSGRRRIEELNEARQLRELLEDWDD